MPSAATTRMEIQIPVAWSVVLEDQARLLEVLSLGLEEYRLRQAITLYRSGEFSLAAAAVPIRFGIRQLSARTNGFVINSRSSTSNPSCISSEYRTPQFAFKAAATTRPSQKLNE